MGRQAKWKLELQVLYLASPEIFEAMKTIQMGPTISHVLQSQHVVDYWSVDAAVTLPSSDYHWNGSDSVNFVVFMEWWRIDEVILRS
jgi:hypothetical protein